LACIIFKPAILTTRFIVLKRPLRLIPNG